MEYRIYPLKDQSRLEELCELFAKGLADTTPQYWKWKHFTENGQPEGMILVAEAEDGSFAGMFALQPEWYGRGDQRVLMVQTEDLVIDPLHRGTGLMRKLYSYAMEYYAGMGAIGFVSFCNENSYPIFLKYGSVDRGYIYTQNSRKSYIPFYFNRNCVTHGHWKLEVTDKMPQDLFFETNCNGYGMMKNSVFMKWKFADNPDGSFRWLTIRENGTLAGYIVMHITQGRLCRAVNIYDWALRDTISENILNEAVKMMKTYGNWVSLWGKYDGATKKRWENAGLMKQSEKGTHFVLHQLGVASLPDDWHLTRADLDY